MTESIGDLYERIGLVLRKATVAAQGEIASHLLEWQSLEDVAILTNFEEHQGDTAQVVDGRAHHKMSTILTLGLKTKVHVRGEENKSTIAIMPNEFLVLTDPLDGTAPARHLGSAHASVALAYAYPPLGRLTIVAAAICGPSGIIVRWTADGSVWRGRAGVKAESDVLATDLNDTSTAVAVVAHKPCDREQFRDVVTSSAKDFASAISTDPSKFSIYNTGGSPATWALIGLELGAIFSRKAQAPYDAAYLLPLIDLGGTVLTANGPVGVDEVRGWFNQGAMDFLDETKIGDKERGRTVPPHVAATSERLASLLVDHFGF